MEEQVDWFSCIEDPLDSEEDLVENLVMLGQIARCKYEGSTDVLIAVFDPIAIQYQVCSLEIEKGIRDWFSL